MTLLERLADDPVTRGRVGADALLERMTGPAFIKRFVLSRALRYARFTGGVFALLLGITVAHRLMQRAAVLLNGRLLDRMPLQRWLTLVELLFLLALGVGFFVFRKRLGDTLASFMSAVTLVDGAEDRSLLGKAIAAFTKQHAVSHLERGLRLALMGVFIVLLVLLMWQAPPWEWGNLYSTQRVGRPFGRFLIRSIELSLVYALVALVSAHAVAQYRLLVGLTAAKTKRTEGATLEPLAISESQTAQQTPMLRVAHLSDLHLLGDSAAQRVEGGAAGDASFAHLMQHHARVFSAVDAIVVTGDVTDAGRAEEWGAFARSIPSELWAKIVLVPGNHDLNVTDGRDVSAIEREGTPARWLRYVRLLFVMDAFGGERSFLVDDHKAVVPLRQWLARHHDVLELFYLDPLMGDLPAVAKLCEQAFPMRVEVAGAAASFFVLDSNDTASSIADNAFGRLREQSLERLAALESGTTGLQLIALHHHVALPTELFVVAVFKRFKDLLFIPAMVLQNARALLHRLSTARPVVIFHGHRHVRYEASLDRVHTVVSAPSSTLGDEISGIREPAFATFDVRVNQPGASIEAMHWHRCTRACGLSPANERA